jgi:hypothetical protein
MIKIGKFESTGSEMPEGNIPLELTGEIHENWW